MPITKKDIVKSSYSELKKKYPNVKQLKVAELFEYFLEEIGIILKDQDKKLYIRNFATMYTQYTKERPSRNVRSNTPGPVLPPYYKMKMKFSPKLKETINKNLNLK